MTNANGLHDTNFTFEFGKDTSVDESCSSVLRNEFYVFGGYGDYRRQISKLSGVRLERIESLDFDFRLGACANFNDQNIYLCFPSGSSEDQKRCRYGDNFEQEPVFFNNIQSAYEHRKTRIAASKRHIFAVGNFADHNKAELLKIENDSWINVQDYPYVQTKRNFIYGHAMIYHNGGFLIFGGYLGVIL